MNSVSGDTNNTATWPGGVLPSASDTIIIKDGTTLTNPTGNTFISGNSPADDSGTPALQTESASGTGIFVNHGTYKYRGPVRQGSANWVGSAGSTLTHDSSLAAVPATANYTWQVGETAGNSTKLSLNGAVGSRVTLNVASGSGRAGGFRMSGSKTGQVQGTYCDVTQWGSSTLALVDCQLSSGDGMHFTRSIIDDCGRIKCADLGNGADYYLDWTVIKNPAGLYAWGMDAGGNGASIAPSSGTRGLTNSSIEGFVEVFNYSVSNAAAGFVFRNLILAGRTDVGTIRALGSMAADEWENVLTYNRQAWSGGADQMCSGTILRTIALRETAGANGHWYESMSATATWDGFIVESLNACTSGDVFQPTFRNGSDYTLDFKNGVLLPTAAGDPIGGFVTQSTSSAHNGTTVRYPTVTVEHCTYKLLDTSDSLGMGGENNTGKSGLYKVRSCIGWRSASGSGFFTKWQDATTPGSGTHVDCDYNGYHNVTGERYKHLTAIPATYTGTTGANDVSAPPDFVNDTRRFLTWGQSLDGSLTTWAGVFTKMRECIQGLNSTFTVSAAYDWIAAGWYASNAALHGTAHDGGDIGIAALSAPPSALATILTALDGEEHMYASIPRGSTSQIQEILVRDDAGFLLTGLTNATAGLTCYYTIDTATPVAVPLLAMTLNAFTSGGFKEVDAINKPGAYQFCPPNLALASGKRVKFQFMGLGLLGNMLIVDLPQSDPYAAAVAPTALAQEVLKAVSWIMGNKIELDGAEVVLYDTDGTTELGRAPFTRLGTPANPMLSVGG